MRVTRPWIALALGAGALMIELDGARAVGCSTEVDEALAFPGPKVVAVATECSIDGAGTKRPVSWNGRAAADPDGIGASSQTAADLNGDGHAGIDHRMGAGLDCPPPDEEGAVTSLVCPLPE